MKIASKKQASRVLAIVVSFLIMFTSILFVNPSVTHATSSDAILSSSAYVVDNVNNTITAVPYSDRNVDVFRSKLATAPGAVFKVYRDGENDKKAEAVTGDIVSGNEVVVTAEDGTTTKTYTAWIDGQYNAEVQFSHIQGHNNWYYKEYVDGQAKMMQWDKSGKWDTWVGSAEFSIMWKDMLHPDTNSQPARVFKAPKNGKLAVDSYIRKMQEASNGVKVKILKNNQVIWPASGEWITITDTVQKNIHLEDVIVQKGDELAFVLDNNGNSAADTTYWLITLTYMPEPQTISSIEITGDMAIQLPVSGSSSSTYTGTVRDQNDEAISAEKVGWSINPAVDGVSVAQDGTVTVQSSVAASSFNLEAASVTNPLIKASKPVLLTDSSQKITNDELNKLLILNSNNVSMLIDYNNKAKIISLKVNGVETLDADGVTTSIEAPRGSAPMGTALLADMPQPAISGNIATLNGIVYSNDKLTVNEKWIFTVNTEDIKWGIERTFNTPDAANISIEQKTAGFTFKKDIFDTAYRSDGGSQVLLSPSNRSKILAFDPYDKQYGTTEAGMAYEGGGVDLVNIPKGFILSMESTSDKKVVSEFYRAPYSLALKFDNKLNSQAFTHTMYRPAFDLGFHCFIPAYGEHSYDPVTVGNTQVDTQEYTIKAYTSMDKYYDIGTLPPTAGIDEYKFGRFLSEFGRTAIVDLNGIGGSWNALRLEFADTMAGQYAVGIMNGMQYTDKNSTALKSLKALVEAAIRTQKANGHMVGCPEISGQANNYENVSEADAAVPMDAAAYINATKDIGWANNVKDAVRKALDYRLSKDANSNGLLESEIDNNYGRGYHAWLDVLYVGGEDAYVNALMYSALTEWADIEQNVIGDSEKAAYYRTKAQKLKETYNKDLQDGGFWSDSYQGFIGWRFLDGTVKADVKYLHVNATAIANGVAEKQRAQDFLFGAFDGYKDIEDWMAKNSAKAYPLNLQSLDKTEIVERFLNEWPGWENGQIFPQTTADMMAAYARVGSTIPIKYMKNLINLYYQEGDPMYHDDTFEWNFGTNTFNCNTRMAINVASAAAFITDIFGFKPRFQGLEVNPVLDESLYGSEINYNMRGHSYKVRFDNLKTRTLMINDGAEKVIFKWNNLVPGAEYSFIDEDLTNNKQLSATVQADENGIASYEINGAGQRRITVSGPEVTPAAGSKMYKATAGFSGAQGVNNWSYYEISNSGAIPLQWNQESGQWENADKSVEVSCRLMQAGTGKQAVREFKVPENGVVEISGSIRLRDIAQQGSKVRIMKNGNPWWPAADSFSIGSNLGKGFKGIMNVVKDDLIQFVVEGSEPVIWAPKIAYMENYNGQDSFSVSDMPRYVPFKTEYNAAQSFATVQGIDNWYYEEYVNNTAKPMHWSNEYSAWQGSATFALIAADWMHPESGVDSCRTFKAPYSGKIEISGDIRKGPSEGDGVKVHIIKNGEVVWPLDGQWKLLADTNAVGSNVVLNVEADDRIGFIVNCNSTTNGDTTFWAPDIKYLETYEREFDAVKGFSGEQGKNNWYYRELVNGQAKDMAWNGAWNAWQGSAQFALIWDKVMHPDFDKVNGVAHQSARVFRAPRDGRVAVTGSVNKDNGNGTGSNVQILKNGSKVWPVDKEWQLITGPEAVEANIQLNVAAGDEIAFVVDSNGESTDSDATNWAPVVSYLGGTNIDDQLKQDATLSGLDISAGVLTPQFSPGTTEYSATVKYNVNSIVILPTPKNSNAAVEVNGKAVAGGSAAGPISLNTGENIIFIDVTAEDGVSKKTYKLSVYREKTESFNALEGFSNEQGKNNWYYREFVNGQATDMIWNGGWNAWQGSAQFALIWDKVMHPDYDKVNGAAHQSARIFKAPKDGTISITGSVNQDKENSGNGTNVQIKKNSTVIWPEGGSEWQHVWGPAIVNTDVRVDVKAGDEIAFIVDSNGPDTASDATNWIPVITYELEADIPVTGISLDKTGISLIEGETCRLTAAVTPENATNKDVVWSSGNEAVAIVDNYGLITAVSEGTATVTASVYGGTYFAECTVAVSPKIINVTGVNLNKTEIQMEKSTTFQLAASVTPENATNKSVIWRSNNEAVATVDANGLVTSYKPGKADITATAVDGGYEARCEVTVSGNVIVVDKTLLTAKIAEALKLKKTEYTAGTWAALENVLAKAKAVNDNANATQNDVDEILRELVQAINGLQKVSTGGNNNWVPQPEIKQNELQIKVGKEGIELSGAKAQLDNTNTAKLTVSSQILQKAFDEAKADKDQVKKVTIIMPEVKGAKAYAAELPSDMVTLVKDDRVVSISTPVGTIVIPGNMIDKNDVAGKEKVEIVIGVAENSAASPENKNMIGSRPIIELTAKAGGKVIEWNNPESPVTVSVDYKPTQEELKDPEHIVILYIDGKGNTIPVTNGRYVQAEGKVVFTTTHFSKYAVAYVKKTFDDIEKYNWAKKQIEVLASKGIIDTDEANYKPEVNITRGEFMALLVRALGLTARVETNFADVKEDYKYYREIGIARKLGIAAGGSGNRFNPNGTISRQDMMVLVSRTLKAEGRVSVKGTAEDIGKFTDAAKVSRYAVEDVAAVIKEGIIQGNGNRLNPYGYTTKAAAAVVIYKIINI